MFMVHVIQVSNVCLYVRVLMLLAVFEPIGELLWNEGRLCFDSALRHL